jgi:hypothetical protein
MRCEARPHQHLGRQEAAAYATRGGRGVRYARTIVNAHHVSLSYVQSPCALYVPNYTVQSLRARGKRAVSRLTSRFRVASYCRRVTWCATSTASAAAASTTTTAMHCPTHRRLRQALRHDNDAQPDRFSRPAWPRRALRSHDHQREPRKLSVPLTILPRRYAPAASLQSFYLTLSDCKNWESINLT